MDLGGSEIDIELIHFRPSQLGGVSMGSWPGPVYEIEQTFHAPMSFVYRWLTDYSTEDPDLEKGSYQRKVISKGRHRAVLEDLTQTENGWEWYRSFVTLHPPDRWHAETRGNVPDWSLDYRLTPLTPNRTRITIRWHIRPNRAFRIHPIPPKSATVRMMRRLWKNFATALDREYGTKTHRRRARAKQ
jgi:hypothetical protein